MRPVFTFPKAPSFARLLVRLLRHPCALIALCLSLCVLGGLPVLRAEGEAVRVLSQPPAPPASGSSGATRVDLSGSDSTADPPVAPTATDDSYITGEDTVLAVSPETGLLANDIAPEATTLTAVLEAGPAHGALTLNGDGSFTYTPEPDYNGTDSFKYHAACGGADSAPATVSISVSETNDPPSASGDTLQGGAQISIPVSQLLANDAAGPGNESGQALTVVEVGPAAHGTVLLSDGAISYTPDEGYTGADQFSYTVSDDGTTAGASDPRIAAATVTLNGSTSLTGKDLAFRLGAASLLATQTRPTNAGENTCELDQLFACPDGANLRIGLTGNLAASGYGVVVLLDTRSGGASTFGSGGPSASRRIKGLAGTVWDDGFQPDYALEITSRDSGLSADLYTLSSGARTRLGSLVEGQAATFESGAALAYDGSNTLGVTEASAQGAQTATGGLEASLPLSLIGSPAADASVRVMALLVDSDGNLTTQTLPGLPDTFLPGSSPLDFRTLPGRQYALLNMDVSASDLPSESVRWAYAPVNLSGDPAQDAHPPVLSIPTVYRGIAYVVQAVEHADGTETGILVALDVTSHGTARPARGFAEDRGGRVQLDGPIFGRVAVRSGAGGERLYLVTNKGTLYMMDAGTGANLRTLHLLDSPGAVSRSTPAVIEIDEVASVFVGVEDHITGRAYLIKATDTDTPAITGSVDITGDPFSIPDRFTSTTSNVFAAPSIIRDGTRVQIGTYDLTFDPLTGTHVYGMLYTLGTDLTVYNAVKMGPLVAPPTLSRDSQYLYVGTLPGYDNTGFAAYNASNGSLLWEKAVTGYVSTIPFIDYESPQSTVYFGTSTGHLYSVDPMTGADLGAAPVQPFGPVGVTGGLSLGGATGTTAAASSLYVPTEKGLYVVPTTDPNGTMRYPVLSSTYTTSSTGKQPGSTIVTTSGNGNVYGLVVQAAAPSDPAQVYRNVLLPPGPDNPRNSEGDFITLKDGRLMFVYTHFVSGSADYSNAFLAARFSSDGGRTWTSGDVKVVSAESGLNVMSVTLHRMADGSIGLFYLRKRSYSDCRPVLRRSYDEGLTWSEPQEVITDEVGYYVMNNDRVLQLPDGRLLVPVALHKGADGAFISRGRATCYISDDDGQTWRRCNTVLELTDHPESPSGLQEPGIVDLSDGRLMMFCRTSVGCQYTSYSQDNGETWSPARPSAIRSPLSPASIKRIPSTGDLVLLWNDNYDPRVGAQAGARTPFTVEISQDDGRTWTKRKVLEDAPYGWYCYTAIHFVGNDIILGHCAGDRRINGLETTQMTLFPVAWLYGNPQ